MVAMRPSSTQAGGQVFFLNSSSAEEMILTNTGASGVSEISFSGRSNGDDAEFINESPHKLDFSATTGPSGNRQISAGKITNAGTMSIGLNTLSVTETFTQSRTGILRLDITRASGGRINVADAAVIAGRVVFNGQNDLPKGRHLILRANGGLTGKFRLAQFIGFPAGAPPVIVYTATDVILRVP